MKAKKILSIIIPYYQETAADLFFLLAGIGGQVGIRFDKIECLLVNDGGGERLPEDFIALFGSLSPRCIYLEENRGPGVARQAGLDQAQGEYVMFCDADDTLHHVWALRTFLEAIGKNHPDLIYTPIIIEYYSPVNKQYLYVHKDDMVQTLHGKVYNRAYLRENNIRFHEKLRLYEDIYFNEIAFADSQKIQKIAETSYLKKYRADSITHSDSYSYFMETITDNIRSVGYLCDEFQTRYPEKLPGLLAQKAVYFYFIMHWPQWRGANERLLLKKAEEALRGMLIPRMRIFDRVSEADFAQIYNQKRARYYTWNGEIEPFAEWLERVLRG